VAEHVWSRRASMLRKVILGVSVKGTLVMFRSTLAEFARAPLSIVRQGRGSSTLNQAIFARSSS
jgi:hypothetical protein